MTHRLDIGLWRRLQECAASSPAGVGLLWGWCKPGGDEGVDDDMIVVGASSLGVDPAVWERELIVSWAALPVGLSVVGVFAMNDEAPLGTYT